MELFLIILIILFLCRIFGEIAQKVGQPSLVGELTAGIVLGFFIHHFGAFYGLSLDFADEESFKTVTDLGIFFLMLLAGLELQPREMTEASKSSFGIAVGGLLLPFALGCGLAWFAFPESDYKFAQTLFLGTAMAITAVPVAVRVLMDLDKLDTKIGRSIVSAAVIDDVLSLMLLAILVGIVQTGVAPSIFALSLLTAKVIAFFAICTVIGKYFWPFYAKLLKKGEVEEGDFSGLLIMAFGFALLAEAFSLHFIIGAFLAGLLFQKQQAGNAMFKRIEKRAQGISSGFLAPIFFASIGLHVTFGAVFETPLFLAVLLILAVAGKLLGAGIPAYLQNKNIKDAAIIGTAMNGRGAVELIIVDIALRANLFAYPEGPAPVIDNLFSSIVIMAIVTTIMTPLILKRLISGK